MLFFLSCSSGQFDMDGDGEITTEELRSAMTKLMGEHMSRREIDAIVKEADDNGDGTVDFEGMSRPHETSINAFKYKKNSKTFVGGEEVAMLARFGTNAITKV